MKVSYIYTGGMKVFIFVMKVSYIYTGGMKAQYLYACSEMTSHYACMTTVVNDKKKGREQNMNMHVNSYMVAQGLNVHTTVLY